MSDAALIYLAGLAGIPLLVDKRWPNIALVEERPRRWVLKGSESAFGAIWAFHLAEAYRPEGVPRWV